MTAPVRPYGSLLLIVLAAGVLRAQDFADTTARVSPDSLPVNFAGIQLERNLNTFNWIGRAFLDTTAAGTSIRLREQYASNTILIDGTPRRRLESNQQNIALRLGRPLTDDLSAQASWSSLIYSDNKTVGLSNASNHSALGGVEYTAIPFVTLTPLAGYRWDNQADVHDRGISYHLSARTRGLVLDGYRIDGRAQFSEDRVDPRLLERHFAVVNVHKSFLGVTRDSLGLGFFRHRREFYTLADSNIESRLENVVTFSNILDYEMDPTIITSLSVHITGRSLDKDLRMIPGAVDTVKQFDTAIDEFRLDAVLRAAYRSEDGRTSATARLQYSERNEAHSAKPIPGAGPDVELLFNERNRREQTKDNLARRTLLSGNVEFPLSLSDRVMISGSGSILRYDTPSTLNVEDRDELLVAFSLGTAHRLSRFLDVSVTLDGTLSHIVYLFKERSANNNYNRVLRLSPRTVYRPWSGLTTMNAFEVLANYTVYDFEQQLGLIRSFSYRQFGWVDSTSISLTERIGLDFLGYLKLYERGQLRWREFTERTENSFLDQTYALQLRFSPEAGTQFAVGVRYFSQSRYTFVDRAKVLDLFVRSVGPTCGILWAIGSYGRLDLRGWYEQRTLTGGGSRALVNMQMNLLVHF